MNEIPITYLHAHCMINIEMNSSHALSAVESEIVKLFRWISFFDWFFS